MNKSCFFGVLVLVVLSLSLQCAKASSVTATQTGNWNQTDTWGGNAVPGCYDTIVIPFGMTVTVTANANLEGCPPVAIIVEGNLAFQNGKRLFLSNGSYVYIAPGGTLNNGGGGGNSTLITIGGTDYWSAGCTGNPPPNCGQMAGPGIICQNCSLPIELISFAAKLSGGIVEIEWQTASETNNDYFLIERSSDGVDWETVDIVDGADDSYTLISYVSEDRNPFLGVSYYRLKQVDNNGAYSFSETRVISHGGSVSGQQLIVISSGTDAQPTIAIYFGDSSDLQTSVQLISLSGAVVFDKTFSTSDQNWVVFSPNRPLSSGLYVVKANRKIETVYFQ